MGGEELIEVWASSSVLVSFDGRVLEVFGLVDVERIHIAFRPVILFPGKSRVTIRPERGAPYTFFADPERRPDLQPLAERVLAAHPPRNA